MQLERILLILLALLSVGVRPAAAHGIGTLQKLNVPSGPYFLSIWTDPDPLRVDETHVTVAVMEPLTQEPIVEGVQVLVQLQSPIDPTVTFTAEALPDSSANKLLYAAIFNDLPKTGLWQGVVSVVGPQGPGENVSFSIEITPSQPVNWLQFGIIGLVLLLFGWIVWSARGKNQQDGQ